MAVNHVLGPAVLALVALTLAHAPPLDSWSPFRDQRIVSESGRYYAVVLGNHGKAPLRFELVRRRDGVGPIEPAEGDGWLESVADSPEDEARAEAELAKVARDPTDVLIASGTMPQTPLDLQLIEEPLGLLLFDQHGSVGYGQVLSWCNAEGVVAWSHDLNALFGGTPEGSSHSVSSIWWSAAWGYDAESGRGWVLTNGHEMRAVDLASGAIETPGEIDIAGVAARADDGDCHALLDAAIHAENVDYRPFAEPFAAISRNEKRPLAVRLRAALVAQRGGGEVPYVEYLFRSTARIAQLEDARFAGLHLAEIADEPTASVPELVSLLCRENTLSVNFGTWNLDQYERAFREADQWGLSALHRLSENPDVPPSANLNAAILLWRLDRDIFPMRLEYLLQHGGEGVANSALNSLIYSEPEGLHEFLVRMSEHGTDDPVRLAMYFQRHPTKAAVAGLRSRLPEFDPDADEFEVDTIRNAISACEGARD